MGAIHWGSFFFLFFALVTCTFAVAVVISNNIVRMATYLVASLCGVAGLFFLAGAQFLGAMQLMLYVGGTVVLLIFGVMLTARGPFVSMRSGGGQWILALLVGGALLAVLMQTVAAVRPLAAPGAAVANSSTEKSDGKPAEQPRATADGAAEPLITTQLGAGLVGVRTDQVGRKTAAGDNAVVAGYLLPFEIVSIHLLVVLVGAAYLARAKRRLASSPSLPEEGQ